MKRSRRSPAFALGASLTLVLALAGCGNPAGQPGSSAGTDDAPVASSADTRAAELRSREQDLLAGRPLASRVHHAVGKPGTRDSMRFDAYFAGHDLICIQALPPAKGGSQSHSTIVYDRGKPLGYLYEVRETRANGDHSEHTEHILFAPTGEVVATEATQNGMPQAMPKSFHQGMVAFARRLSADQYDDMIKLAPR